MYVIQRTRDDLTGQTGGYVSRPGSASSYTYALQNARVFETVEEADGHRCPGNEIIISLDSILRPS